MRLKTQPWLLICDATPLQSPPKQPGEKNDDSFPSLNQAANIPTIEGDPHLQYIRHLQARQSGMTAVDQFGSGYQDYLQAPLQPLTVNLESITYEVFEKDPIKYEWYERATARALHDWIEQGKPTSNPDGRVVVAVAGAGRGPLVSRALKAAEDTGIDIDMWALEKNPNAFVLLQRHNENKWGGKVSLVKSDMRTWLGPHTNQNLSAIRKTFNIDPDEAEQEGTSQAPTIPEDQNLSASSILMPQNNRYKIDILISELLGSFADNELSPECLDGVQHLLNPTHGISIPASYTAHFTPIAAPKLHADISLSMVNVNLTASEIPYVVMLDQIDFLSPSTSTTTAPPNTATSPAKQKTLPNLLTKNSRQGSAPAASTAPTKPSPNIQTAWSFHHPNHSITSPPLANAHNARHCRISFPISHPSTMHGLAGYFETILYPGVELSTNPITMEDKSGGMISWFPIFFPLRTPMFVPEGGVVDVSMWRQTDDRRVWYEWMVEVYAMQGTKRCKVGSSELHSSEKEACLM